MPITETFSGFIETTTDALLIFEACRRGMLPKISRRLQDRERGSIKSGTVFVFDEKDSGIKRWTDGLVWSPSRILGNFLIYRELDGRESLYQKLPIEYDSPYLPIPAQQHQQQQLGIQDALEPHLGELSNEERERERNLVGSLTDTYKFRKGGLIKKTISIHLNGSTQHMISYYTRSDVLEGRLATPSSVSDLSSLQISPELLLKQSFRVPPSVEFAELMLKRPSLSPSSTNSSASTTTGNTVYRKFSCAAATPKHHSPYEIQHRARVSEDYQSLSLDHSRRLSFESISDNRKYARVSVRDQHESSRRRSSFFLPSNESRASSLSVNTGRTASFSPLPLPTRPPHYLHQQQQQQQQHHEGKNMLAPTSPLNDTCTRTSSAMNGSSRASFNTTDLFPSNRSLSQQRYHQPSVSNDIMTKSNFRLDEQEPFSSPFRFQKHENSHVPSAYERNNGPSLPSPSSLIWSSSSANVHHPQQEYHESSDKTMYFSRPSPPPLSQTTATSPLSLEPTSTYSSPTGTYYHRYDKQQANNENNSTKCYPSFSSSNTMFNSRNSIHQQLFSSGNNI